MGLLQARSALEASGTAAAWSRRQSVFPGACSLMQLSDKTSVGDASPHTCVPAPVHAVWGGCGGGGCEAPPPPKLSMTPQQLLSAKTRLRQTCPPSIPELLQVSVR